VASWAHPTSAPGGRWSSAVSSPTWSSVGALTGAIAAAHPTSAAPWLDEVWRQLRRPEAFPLRANLFITHGGMNRISCLQQRILTGVSQHREPPGLSR
jgi:hypothetical protein